MEIISGKSVFAGIAIGRVMVWEKENQSIKRTHTEDTQAELERVKRASEKAVGQLEKLYEKAVKEFGESGAAIFDVHQMMIQDGDYQESIRHIITTQNTNAEFAVATTGDNFASMFSGMKDEYMKARAEDVKDISTRIINILAGKEERTLGGEEPVIILAEDLAPSETVQMDTGKVLAFVTRLGSTNSHTAILARTMNIPALICVEFSNDFDGKLAIVDGVSGALIINPDEATLREYSKRIHNDQEKAAMLQELRGKETITRDGKRIKLYANIGNASDVAFVHRNDGEGIGLFRSEFIYLGRDTYPTEEEQFQVYKTVAQNMAGKKVIIRTLDIGADKQVDYFNLAKEENPALGYRAIRICLDRVELFKTQLRAILRASAFGNISIMYPMIISVGEIKKVKEIFGEVRDGLKQEKYPYGEVEQGIMIETPAAVMVSDDLAKEVDFFSIGTNDLTQYTLAIDRQNSKLDSFYDAHHPAILRMIQMVIDHGHKENCWVGICGELAADTALTKTFIEMGIDELSVSPSFVLPIRKLVREL